ncbi:MAG TPA: SMC-Scp complex subunit ScpB [archaeon]|nr:SMC-Scp complex subunit ScpB [archaeon]
MPELNLDESTIHRNLIEAALFMSPKPLNMEELMRATGIGSLGYLKETLKDLQKDYSEKGLEILENPEGWHMKVRKEYLPRVAHLTPNADLSEGCKKALALIIYKEPFKQSELIRIQGTKAYEYAKELEKRGLIKREKAGHTKILKVTSELENYFGETKEQIRKRIFQALDEKAPALDKQKTINEYSDEPEQEKDNAKEEVVEESRPENNIVNKKFILEAQVKKELNKHLENVLEDDIDVKEDTLDDEFGSEPPITGRKRSEDRFLVGKKSKQKGLKPIRRENPVKVKLPKEQKTEEIKVETKKEEENADKKIRKAAGLAGIKELTLDDLKK